jgi:hypothetical protein
MKWTYQSVSSYKTFLDHPVPDITAFNEYICSVLFKIIFLTNVVVLLHSLELSETRCKDKFLWQL